MSSSKRGFGIFVDEETGEESVVQTSKQAKRAHQKSGKWYKEPTEAELRAWDREEEIQREQDKIREKNRKKKAAAGRRAEQMAKEKSQKSQLYRQGKLSFEQMASKRKQNQQSLHTFFTRVNPDTTKPQDNGRPKESEDGLHHEVELGKDDKLSS